MTQDCDQYLEDPEAYAAHAETCAECSALAAGLEVPEVAARPVSLDALPMAAWEGASHRTWPLVIAGVIAVSILAMVLWTATGVSPVATMSSTLPPFDALLKMIQLTGKGIGGPTVVAVLFVVINSILFLLLRRAPKGIDV
jgi:hypothetical protein